MCTRYQNVDRKTQFLFSISLDDSLPDEHLARFVVEIVDNLNISNIENAYSGSGGTAAYNPKMLLALLFYGYATGVFSSRKIEKATYDVIPFRFIAGNTHPDHDTISNFRKRFLPHISALFTQILEIASRVGCLNLGTISLDGTKIHANASKHSAYSYGYACELEKRLEQEVEELLQRAEKSDNEPLPDELDIPAELLRRNERLDAIRMAKKEIECRAAKRHEKELEEYQNKQSARQAKEAATGKKIGGKEPKAPEGPLPQNKDQMNLTDAESRIMPISGGGFEQCYNAQAAVDTESYFIVITDVTQDTNDKETLIPALEKLKELPPSLSRPEKLLADAGYYSEANLAECEAEQIEPYIPCRREAHYWDIRKCFNPEEPPGVPKDTPSDRVKYRMQTKVGKKIFAKRKCTIEPVFGVIKAVMGFRQFLFRGLSNVCHEWRLVCLAWNLKRLHKLIQLG